MSGRHFLCLRGSWCQGALPRRLSHSKHVAGPAGEVKGQGICPFCPVLGEMEEDEPGGLLTVLTSCRGGDGCAKGCVGQGHFPLTEGLWVGIKVNSPEG